MTLLKPIAACPAFVILTFVTLLPGERPLSGQETRKEKGNIIPLPGGRPPTGQGERGDKGKGDDIPAPGGRPLPVQEARGDEGGAIAEGVEIHVRATRAKLRQLDPVEIVVQYANASDREVIVDDNGSLNGGQVATERFLLKIRRDGEAVRRTDFFKQARAPVRSYFEKPLIETGSQSGPGTMVRTLAPSATRTDKVVVNLLYDMSHLGQYTIKVGLPVRDLAGTETGVVWSDPVSVEVAPYFQAK